MQSDGGLTYLESFSGHKAILSGPAGGAVGYAKVALANLNSKQPVIGFDMGGTSSDVSRFDGQAFEHVYETSTAGITIQCPQLDIQTVAAGGGSRLSVINGLFKVGPESAGATPGPVCYRKPGGVLALTDANVILGRVVPKYFPHIFGPDENLPLDVEGTRAAFEHLGEDCENELCTKYSMDELAYGFIQVANETMCRPIRNLTQMRGFDLTNHVLVCFGGAGPQRTFCLFKKIYIQMIFKTIFR